MAQEALREELVSLWQTEETRAYRPDAMDEVRNGLYYFETTLYDLAPEVAASLERAVARHYPGTTVPGRFLRFASWIGGDRDGNPTITVATTEQALRAHHELALRLLRRGIERLHGHLSTTERLGVDAALPAEPRAGRARVPGRGKGRGGALPAPALPAEAALRVPQAGRDARGERAAVARGPRAACRASTGTRRELVADLRLLQESLRAHRGERLAAGRLGTLVRQAEIFGFHLASLDLRQTSDRHTSALAEVLRPLRHRHGYAGMSEDERTRAAHARDPGRPAVRAAPARFQPDTNETLDLFRLVRRAHERVGPARRRELRGQHDARAERPAGRAADGAGRRRLGRARPGAAVRDRRRPAPGARDARAPVREPGLRPPPRRARRRPDGDGGLQRLEQGRRLPDGQLGAAPRPARDRRGVRAPRRPAHALPRPRRHGRARRRPDEPRDPGPAARSRWAAGCASPSRASR